LRSARKSPRGRVHGVEFGVVDLGLRVRKSRGVWGKVSSRVCGSEFNMWSLEFSRIWGEGFKSRG
jgi:hypothetical protein